MIQIKACLFCHSDPKGFAVEPKKGSVQMGMHGALCSA